MLSFPIINSIFGYKLFEFILNIFGLIKEEWIINKYNNEFNEYAPGLFLVRVIFYSTMFLTTIPLLLKKDLESLKSITQFYVITLMFLVLVILLEAPFFRSSYINQENPIIPYEVKLFKSLDWNAVPVFFSFTGCFYS